MKWWVVAGIVIMGVSVADAAETEQALSIDLLMKNEAQVPADVLEKSLDHVTHIYAGAGLEVRWTDAAPRFTVIISTHVLGYARAASPAMGVALRRPGGSMAQVFLKQVQDFARAYRVDLSTMLAYVIAHEVGHLLLPGRPHSEAGLMQAAWDKAIVQNATRGLLTFTDAQAERIRASR